MFRRKPSKDETYVKMREALYRFLWDETHKPEPYFDKNGEIKVRHPIPRPNCTPLFGSKDDDIQHELRKLLGG